MNINKLFSCRTLLRYSLAVVFSVLLTSRPLLAADEGGAIRADVGTARWAFSANAAGLLCFVTPSLQLQASLAEHWSISFRGRTNQMEFFRGDSSKEFRMKENTLAAGVRFWPWYTWSCWWIGLDAQYQEYNRGGLLSRQTEEGDAFGAVLSAGYSIMLSKHFNLDLGLAFWGGRTHYSLYSCPVCGDLLESGWKTFVRPDEVILSLTYVF